MEPRNNLWIESGEQVVLSRWRAALLAAVEETGSINAAAERMGVQYRLAWERLEKMENGLGVRLLHRHVGGAGGGGARLTPEGRDLVERFERYAERVDAAMTNIFDEVFGGA
jgi:molybdate transport system regulatory protein